MSATCPASPIVLLHGWAMRPAVWSEVEHALAATLGAAPLLHTPALPGHELAAPLPAPTLAAWAEALAGELPADAPAGIVLVGWSLGAMLAMELARRHPERVAALVLIGASARFVADRHWPHGLARTVVDAFAQGFARDPQATLKRFAALQVLGDAGGRSLARALAQCSALAPDADAATVATLGERLAAGLEILRTADLRSAASGLRMPCTIVHGEADALMPAGAARWLGGQIAHARLHLLPGAGHALPLSAAAECARLIAAHTRLPAPTHD